MADTRLRAVIVNLTCGQPESRLFNVQWPVGGRAVDEHDIRRVVNEGRARAGIEGREVIHALPLTFAVDQTDDVADPRGLFCEKLAARLHVIDASPPRCVRWAPASRAATWTSANSFRRRWRPAWRRWWRTSASSAPP